MQHSGREPGRAELASRTGLALEQVDDLLALLAGLSHREREVLRARYGVDDDGRELSLRTVGDRLGLSGERVRQIERRALGKLGAAAKGDPPGAGERP